MNQSPTGARGAPGRGGTGWGDPPPPSLVGPIMPRGERIRHYKRNRAPG